MKGFIFFDTNHYKNYQAKVKRANATFFPDVYFEVQLDDTFDKHEKAYEAGELSGEDYEKMAKQYDKLRSFLLGGCVTDFELYAPCHDIDGNGLESDEETEDQYDEMLREYNKNKKLFLAELITHDEFCEAMRNNIVK